MAGWVIPRPIGQNGSAQPERGADRRTARQNWRQRSWSRGCSYTLRRCTQTVSAGIEPSRLVRPRKLDGSAGCASPCRRSMSRDWHLSTLDPRDPSSVTNACEHGALSSPRREAPGPDGWTEYSARTACQVGGPIFPPTRRVSAPLPLNQLSDEVARYVLGSSAESY